MQKAYCYLRVSGKGQLRGDGPERQRSKITRYCKVNSIEPMRWYTESESGTEQDRPELARLMVDLKENGPDVQTVLIERLDRLARDVMVQEAIIRDFTKMGVQLISVDEGPDLASDDPTRELLRVFIGAVAQYEKRILVGKLRAARERKRRRFGKCEGVKAYGEDSPEEQEVVRRIRLMRRRRKGGYAGMTYKQIAELLNEEGIPTKKGGTWTVQKVYHVARSK